MSKNTREKARRRLHADSHDFQTNEARRRRPQESFIMKGMTIVELTALYADYGKLYGLRLGSADEHTHDSNLTETQRQWMRNFCEAWNEAEAREETGVEIGKFEVGTADWRQHIQILHNTSNLYTVRNWQDIEGERSPSKSAQFVNARLAFKHAVEIAENEIDDLVETLED